MVEKILNTEEIEERLELLISLINDKRFSEFKAAVAEIPAEEIAELFDLMSDEYFTAFFRLLPKAVAAETFADMDSVQRENIINSFSQTKVSGTSELLRTDDIVDIIEEMPASVVKRIIRRADSESRESRAIVNELLKYPQDSAGSVMSTEYVRFTKDMTVAEALEHIRRVNRKNIYTCYITDNKRHLIGVVTARELLTTDVDVSLESIMNESVIFAYTGDDKEEVARKFYDYGIIALPVVDNESRLVGIITVDDAIDVINEEHEEDFAKMAAMTPDDTPYLESRVFSLWKSRIPWLLLLMVSATFSSAILTKFESVLPSVLLLFVPMLMGTGGNGGAQASVAVIRSISMGEAHFSDILRVLWKEFRVGSACGAALGAVAFGKVMLVDRLLMQNSAVTVMVAIAVSLAVLLTVLVAKMIGATLPLIAKKIGLDPAVMASPFITTLVDIIALVVYFFTAVMLL